MSANIARFTELRVTDTATAGGKGANLGELTSRHAACLTVHLRSGR